MNINWLPPTVVAASERLAKAINLPDLSGSTVWLAVTGLSRSGKTVFKLRALFHHARQGKKCLYFSTLSEPAMKIVRYMQAVPARPPRSRASGR